MAASSTSASTTASTVRRQTGNGAQLGAMLGVAAGVMFMATLCGAYFSVRNWVGIPDFIPAELKFDNYSGFMTMVCALAASLSAEWALASTRVKQRRWATAGYGLAAFFIVSGMNAVWFIGQRSGLAAGETPYAIAFYAVWSAVLALFVVGLLAALATLVRVLGGHSDGDDLLIGRAGNWLIHLSTAAAVTAFFLIYTYK
jgi:heme/copper-type cytochrome/quinol oxidase subunit 3